jgi:predicted extracellular nuclease
MRIFALITLLTIIVCSCSSKKETSKDEDHSKQELVERNSFRFMFYNVENLFDTEDDPEKNDQEFLPDQGKYWTPKRYKTKLNQIYQVITAVGGWELPEIVGLSEIENRKVLEDLVNQTPLFRANYKIIHYESPDSRGIDVALLYREDRFTPDHSRPIPVTFPKNMGRSTRDILYVRGRTVNNDTLHVFINHWPSRWGGQMETEEKRMFCANIVRRVTDSIMKAQPGANIIVSGDLNDYPTDRSLTETLKTKTNFDNIRHKSLYNLSYYLQEEKGLGTHKYNGHWGILDQIIVSGGLLDITTSLHTSIDNVHIFNEDFLLENDEKYTGQQVYRTYVGYKYKGGFSDHLPVYIDLFFNQ